MNVSNRKTSMRYGGGHGFDARSFMIRIFGFLQRKKIVILDSDPKLCGEILAASDTKGTFLETLIATPAWHPIYSVESMDGARWEQLSQDFSKLMGQIGWRRRLEPLTQRYALELVESVRHTGRKVDSEQISKLVLRVLFELLFEQRIPLQDEEVFYQASIEWRKEIAVKGKADSKVKAEFWTRLTAWVERSRFKEGLESYRRDPSCWLSIFAQPFFISPQINISDIFVSVFYFLRLDPELFKSARNWARIEDKARLNGVILESIRLRHPFPILERELKKDLQFHGELHKAGTQFFILMDQFKQDKKFNPERWLLSPAENPYFSIPFAAGPRMCIGKPIAMELQVEMLKIFLSQLDEAQIQPQIGHRYSGRNNDRTGSVAESLYQVRVFARALWRSLWIGRAQAKQECPWKGHR